MRRVVRRVSLVFHTLKSYRELMLMRWRGQLRGRRGLTTTPRSVARPPPQHCPRTSPTRRQETRKTTHQPDQHRPRRQHRHQSDHRQDRVHALLLLAVRPAQLGLGRKLLDPPGLGQVRVRRVREGECEGGREPDCTEGEADRIVVEVAEEEGEGERAVRAEGEEGGGRAEKVLRCKRHVSKLPMGE